MSFFQHYVDERLPQHKFFNQINTLFMINLMEIEKYGNNKEVFAKEMRMCEGFAEKVYKIKMIEESGREATCDILLNGKPADLKSLTSHNNIVRHAKEAVRKKGAEVMVF